MKLHFKAIIFIIILSVCLFNITRKSKLPNGFVYAKTLMPDLDIELRYFGTNNFVGKTIDGYKSNTLILTKATVMKLMLVQKELQYHNLCLKIFDGYRPHRAVNYFVAWTKLFQDTINKATFYPNVHKRDLFKEEYIASRSGHSRGSTVDLTISDGDTGIPLDMGSCFDFFGKASWVNFKNITSKQKKNRELLQTVMQKYGFKNYPREWWHFTLKNEPFPNRYFNFEIE